MATSAREHSVTLHLSSVYRLSHFDARYGRQHLSSKLQIIPTSLLRLAPSPKNLAPPGGEQANIV